jgi:hypothetical protein
MRLELPNQLGLELFGLLLAEPYVVEAVVTILNPLGAQILILMAAQK